MKLKERAGIIKQDIMALFFALRRPETPWYARVLVVIIVAYALSPIDLIPDFIPVLGYLDDVILLPLAILLAVRLFPPELLRDCRRQASEYAHHRPRSAMGAVVVVIVWIVMASVLAGLAYRSFPG